MDKSQNWTRRTQPNYHKNLVSGKEKKNLWQLCDRIYNGFGDCLFVMQKSVFYTNFNLI